MFRILRFPLFHPAALPGFPALLSGFRVFGFPFLPLWKLHFITTPIIQNPSAFYNPPRPNVGKHTVFLRICNSTERETAAESVPGRFCSRRPGYVVNIDAPAHCRTHTPAHKKSRPRDHVILQARNMHIRKVKIEYETEYYSAMASTASSTFSMAKKSMNSAT